MLFIKFGASLGNSALIEANMNSTDFFFTNPVFTHQEFVGFLDPEGTRNRDSIEALLAYHVKVGHVVRVRRGVFAVVPRGTMPTAVRPDVFQLSMKLADDAVIAFHSALEFQGRAYSLFSRHYFVTRHRLRPFVFAGTTYVPVELSTVLCSSSGPQSGTKSVPYKGGTVNVTTFERTLVDVLDSPQYCGGWEEAWRSLESVDFFDLDAVIELTLLRRNATLNAKVGFYLSQHREELMVEDVHLNALLPHVPKQARYMDRKMRGSASLVQPWNLIVPDAIQLRSWEEPF